MSERPRDSYSIDFIDTLREDVRIAYNHLEKKYPLKPNKTRTSAGYEALRQLLLNKAGKKIELSTLVDFFTKSSVYDPHAKEEVYTFERYTIQAFEELIKIAKSENHYGYAKNSFTAINLDVQQGIRNLLEKLNDRNEAIYTVEKVYVIDEKGACIITSTVFLKAMSDIANVRIQCWNDRPLKLKAIEAHEATIGQRKLPIYPFEVKESSFVGFIIFPNILKENDTYSYTYSFSLDDYVTELLESKEMRYERVITPHTYQNNSDEFWFKDCKEYKVLKFFVKKHPSANLNNIEIKPIKKNGYLIFRIDHGQLKDLNTRIQYEMRLV